MRCLIFLILMLPFFSIGQNGAPVTLGARSIALGNASIGLKGADALLNNPAGLATITSFHAIVAAEQRFANQDLQSIAAGAAISTSSGVIGLSLNYFGFDLYNEQRIGLSYSRSLLQNFSIGAQLVLHNTQIEEYGSKLVPTFEIGLMMEIIPELTVGAYVFNPMRIELNEDELLPTAIRLGFAYAPSDKSLFVAEVSKDIEYPVEVKAGIEYKVVDQLMLRTGISTAPEKWSFGLGYLIENAGLRIDVSASHHQFLGFTPGFSVVYQP
ncbi:MAG: hypothetical protein AAFO07_28870 [Bacteroidota bacterium]